MARFSSLSLVLALCAVPRVVSQLRQLQTPIAASVDAVVTGEDDLTTLLAALTAADLVGVLCPSCNFTLFAPTNDAFAAVDQVFLAKLLTAPWKLHLQNILSFHATEATTDRVVSTDLSDGLVLPMLNKENVTVNIDGASVTISSESDEPATVVEADLLAENGVVHKVSSVLLPTFAVTTLAGLATTPVGSGFTILFELIGLAEIVPDNCTVFAPTDAAFQKLDSATLDSLRQESGRELLTSILLNHVVPAIVPAVSVTDGFTSPTLGALTLTFGVDESGTVMVNDATVVATDVLANNGIVHAIDTVLMMPSTTPTTPTVSAPSASTPTASTPTASAPSASSGNTTTPAGSAAMGPMTWASITLTAVGALIAIM